LILVVDLQFAGKTYKATKLASSFFNVCSAINLLYLSVYWCVTAFDVFTLLPC